MAVENTIFEIMKTLKTLEKGRLITKSLLLLSLLSINYKLSAGEKLSSSFANDLVKDGFVGYYIIGGILVFGILGYLIISLVRKHEKSDDRHHHTINRFNHHRHHHHHRVIKKSS